MVSSSSTFGSHAFSSMAPLTFPFSSSLTPLTLKLDQKNYIYWRSQVLTTARAYSLEGFLLGTISHPNKYYQTHNPTDSFASIRAPNPKFHFWLRHD
ncbi:hypothetical protein TorRG33x02_051980 [Trema orientale]|uniref:Retrotransposon Copia-like N-terminal domain-containing protein n=1 Tax=Trema orientale TaxID=63057 RepID=A0A2P5FMC6_TREOI|nr:hypothetical protein TorRG33x02_051980 [Trema orientale]